MSVDLVKDGQDIHCEAIAAVLRLREHFKPVSRFLEDPAHSVSAAKRQFDSGRRGVLARVFSSTARYRAEASLLLNVWTCLEIRRELDALGEYVADFEGTGDDSGQIELLERVVRTGKKVESCAAYVTNCLNVIGGNDKTLRNPQGPDIGM